MKVSKEVKNRIKYLHTKGYTAYRISKVLHIPSSVAYYWIFTDKERERARKYEREHYKIKMKDKKFRKKKIAYIRKYYANRYKTDDEFRKSIIKSTINYHKKVKNSRNAIIKYLKKHEKATKKKLWELTKKYKIKEKTLDKILSEDIFKVGKRWIRYVG